jgi:hypothetical protein
MVPSCHGEYRKQPLQLPHLDRMMQMIDNRGDDVTMNVGIMMEIVEIKEVV